MSSRRPARRRRSFRNAPGPRRDIQGPRVDAPRQGPEHAAPALRALHRDGALGGLDRAEVGGRSAAPARRSCTRAVERVHPWAVCAPRVRVAAAVAYARPCGAAAAASLRGGGGGGGRAGEPDHPSITESKSSCAPGFASRYAFACTCPIMLSDRTLALLPASPSHPFLMGLLAMPSNFFSRQCYAILDHPMLLLTI